jgi:tRNA(Ile)-lysidine synthase
MSQLQSNLEPIQLQVLQQLTALTTNAQPFYIALSGGLDSSVLLHIVKTLVEQKKIAAVKALHINHGLQQASNSFQQQCEDLCQNYQIELIVEHLNLDGDSSNLEQLARQGRYHVFESQLKPNQVLLMAHHLDDQAETLLFRLLRGCGIQGAAAIPQKRKLGQGWLLRPLLNISRQQLNDYADKYQLQWREDPSNVNQGFSRNFLRHSVLPLLKTRWPNLNKTFARFAQIAQEQSVLLDELAAQDLKIVTLDDGKKTQGICISKIKKLSPLRQKNMLHFWGKTYAQQSPSNNQIEQLLSQLDAGQSKSIELLFGNKKLRSFNQQLFIGEINLPETFERKVEWKTLEKPLTLPNGVKLKMQQDNIQGVRAPLAEETVWVDVRRGGERCCPSTRQHSTQLKQIYQELGVPPWQRKWLPIIYYNDQIVAVAGCFIVKEFAAKKQGTGYGFTIL